MKSIKLQSYFLTLKRVLQDNQKEDQLPYGPLLFLSIAIATRQEQLNT